MLFSWLTPAERGVIERQTNLVEGYRVLSLCNSMAYAPRNVSESVKFSVLNSPNGSLA